MVNSIEYIEFMNPQNFSFCFFIGIDPSTHKIKAENERLKQSMARSQRIKDRKTIMPRLDKKAARRFVRNGLWTAADKTSEVAESASSSQAMEEDWDKESSKEKSPSDPAVSTL